MDGATPTQFDDRSEVTTRRARSLRRGRRQLPAAVLACCATLVLLAQPADARNLIRDYGWQCHTNGAITVHLPWMAHRNLNVRNERVWAQPVVFREINGRFEIHDSVLAGGVAAENGLLGGFPFWGWTIQGTSHTGAVRWTFSGPPGRYMVAMFYRWESSGWFHYFSVVNGTRSATVCEIPK